MRVRQVQSPGERSSDEMMVMVMIMMLMMTMVMMMTMMMTVLMMMTLIGVNDLTFIQAHLGAAISCAVMSRLRLNPIDSSLIHLWEITSSY